MHNRGLNFLSELSCAMIWGEGEATLSEKHCCLTTKAEYFKIAQ